MCLLIDEYDVIDLVANWKLGKTRQNSIHTAFRDWTKLQKAEHIQFQNVLSSTVLTCCEFISHRRRGQDKTRQSCLVRPRLRYKIG